MLRKLVSALNDILCFKRKLIAMFKMPRSTILVQTVVGRRRRHVKFYLTEMLGYLPVVDHMISMQEAPTLSERKRGRKGGMKEGR